MIEEERDIARAAIEDFIEEYLFEGKKSWPAREFQNRSYERGAAFDILRRIDENPNTSPINIIQGFIEEMERFEEMSDTWPMVRICRIARETSEDILKLLL